MNDDFVGVLKGFTIICKKCKSINVELIDSRGYSDESGTWGSVDFTCVDCGSQEEIIDC